MNKPNIVLLHTHDTGRYLGCYGAPVRTPHLSRLAAEGVLFRQAYCASPSCSASRASLFTGRHPHEHGMIGLCHRGFRLHDPGRHFSHVLRAGGYRTQLIGVQHEVPAAEVGQLGYDAVVPDSQLERHSGQRAKLAADWLSRGPREPFFLNVGFWETHRPFLPAEPPDDERSSASLPWLPDVPEVRRDVAALNTAVRHVDDAVGMILQTLAEQQQLENTLVIFTTDHGVPFPRAKGTLHDAGIGVALIMRGPAGFTGGRVVDELVSQIDLVPTLCQVLGLPVPAGARGVDLSPLVTGGTPVREEIFAELNYHAAYDPCRAIRTDRYKLIRHYADGPDWLPANVDAGSSKTHLTDCGLPRGGRPRELLYDLQADPQERENLVDHPDGAERCRDLSQRLDAWMHSTNDPLLLGPIPAPPGAKVTPRADAGPSSRS